MGAWAAAREFARTDAADGLEHARKIKRIVIPQPARHLLDGQVARAPHPQPREIIERREADGAFEQAEVERGEKLAWAASSATSRGWFRRARM